MVCQLPNATDTQSYCPLSLESGPFFLAKLANPRCFASGTSREEWSRQQYKTKRFYGVGEWSGGQLLAADETRCPSVDLRARPLCRCRLTEASTPLSLSAHTLLSAASPISAPYWTASGVDQWSPVLPPAAPAAFTPLPVAFPFRATVSVPSARVRMRQRRLVNSFLPCFVTPRATQLLLLKAFSQNKGSLSL